MQTAISSERRTRAMMISGQLMFSPAGLRALRSLGLAGKNPQPFVPVLASDTVEGVMQLIAGEDHRTLLVLDDQRGRCTRLDLNVSGGAATDLQTIPGETPMEGMLEAIHDGTDLLVGGLRMTARASQTQAA